MTIWITRPESDGNSLQEQLAAKGIASIVSPVLRIVDRPTTLTKKPDAFLLTSRHAARALPTVWRDVPVYCVGRATADIAEARGYTRLRYGEGDLLSLLPLLVKELPVGAHLLHLSGAETRFHTLPLPPEHPLNVTREIIYEAEPETALVPELRIALANGKIDGIVLFSPRSASLACQLLKQEEFTDAAPHIDAFCLSLAVAEAAAALPWRSLKTCHRPSKQAMLALVTAAQRPVAP